MTGEIANRISRWQLIGESMVLGVGVTLSWWGWPQSWDDMAGMMILFSFPCCILPSAIHLFGFTLLVVVPVFAWYRTWSLRIVSIGLVVFTVALGTGLFRLLLHRGDSTEFSPFPYLQCGWFMLLGAAISTAEFRWREQEWRFVTGPLWGAVPIFLLKPFTDIAFAGV